MPRTPQATDRGAFLLACMSWTAAHRGRSEDGIDMAIFKAHRSASVDEANLLKY